MVDPSAIATLEAAAANLDRLLRGWTEARVSETESAPSPLSKSEGLATINAGIQSLWRLVSIHKSIEQLKNPPAATPTSESTSKPGTPISRSANSPQATQPGTPISRSADSLQDPNAPHPSQPAPPAAPQTPYVPYVPSVPVVPSLGSLDEIIAKTDQVYAEITALCQASGIPVPDPIPDSAAAPDQLGLNLLDAFSHRAKYPGTGRLLDSIFADTPP